MEPERSSRRSHRLPEGNSRGASGAEGGEQGGVAAMPGWTEQGLEERMGQHGLRQGPGACELLVGSHRTEKGWENLWTVEVPGTEFDGAVRFQETEWHPEEGQSVSEHPEAGC